MSSVDDVFVLRVSFHTISIIVVIIIITIICIVLQEVKRNAQKIQKKQLKDSPGKQHPPFSSDDNGMRAKWMGMVSF